MYFHGDPDMINARITRENVFLFEPDTTITPEWLTQENRGKMYLPSDPNKTRVFPLEPYHDTKKILELIQNWPRSSSPHNAYRLDYVNCIQPNFCSDDVHRTYRPCRFPVVRLLIAAGRQAWYHWCLNVPDAIGRCSSVCWSLRWLQKSIQYQSRLICMSKQEYFVEESDPRIQLIELWWPMEKQSQSRGRSILKKKGDADFSVRTLWVAMPGLNCSHWCPIDQIRISNLVLWMSPCAPTVGKSTV